MQVSVENLGLLIAVCTFMIWMQLTEIVSQLKKINQRLSK
jgi:hypothetical protein